MMMGWALGVILRKGKLLVLVVGIAGRERFKPSFNLLSG